MTLDVVVTSGNKPVAGLAAQDFVVTDNKKPVANLTVAPSSETNIVLVFDTQNGKITDAPKMVRDLKTFFGHNGGKLQHQVMLIINGRSGQQISESTTDGAKLIAFLGSATTTQVSSMVDAAGPDGEIQRLDKGMHALTDVLNTDVVRAPGRKMVIWMGRSWPFPDIGDMTVASEDSIFRQVVQQSRDVIRNRVILYNADSNSSADADYHPARWQGFQKPPTSAKGIELGDLALEVMAVQSGGQVLNATNNLSEDLERFSADADNFYTITFDETQATKPNEYHPLAIKMAKPEVIARMRTGYYAQP